MSTTLPLRESRRGPKLGGEGMQVKTTKPICVLTEKVPEPTQVRAWRAHSIPSPARKGFSLPGDALKSRNHYCSARQGVGCPTCFHHTGLKGRDLKTSRTSLGGREEGGFFSRNGEQMAIQRGFVISSPPHRKAIAELVFTGIYAHNPQTNPSQHHLLPVLPLTPPS